jgi:hypothetical protein
MSKELTQRMFNDHAYSSVNRKSMIQRPEFRQKMRINGIDVAQLYLDTLEFGAKGNTAYRTVAPYPPIDHETWPFRTSFQSRRGPGKRWRRRSGTR